MAKETVSNIKVNLENAESALKQIQNLNAGVENATVNMQKLNQAFKDAPQTINEFLKQLDKVNSKGHLQGSVTSNDKQALDVRTSDLSELLKDITSVVGANKVTDSASGKSLDSNELKQLNANAERIISLLSGAGINANATVTNGNVSNVGVDPSDALRQAYNQVVRDTSKRGASVNTGFEKSVTDAINKAVSDIRSSNNTLSSTRRTISNIKTTTNAGEVSYARDKQYQGFYQNADESLAKSSQTLSNSKSSLRDIRRSLDSAISNKQDNINNSNSSEDIARYEKELQKLNSLKDKVNLQIDKLSNAQSKVEQGQSSLNSSKVEYNKAKDNGDLNVGVDPDSFRGKMKKHSMGIAALTGAVATGALMSGISSGTSIRRSAYDNGTGAIMLGLANQGVGGRKMDDKILNTLTKTGINNGTHYSGQEMTQFANSYASTNRTGNIKDYNKQADSISQMARFSGMSNDAANSLIQTAGFSGVTNFTDFSKVVSGAIQGNGMAARSSEMASALSSMIGNSANVGNMSESEASRMAAFQGLMNGTHNSAMQGSQGAQAYNAMANGLTNTSSNAARFIFAQSTGFSSEYGSGPEGQFKLGLAMEDARKDPSKLAPVMKQLDQNVGGNKYMLASQLRQLAGGQLTYHQAEEMAKLYKKGDFSKEKLDKVMKEDKEKGSDDKNNKGKQAYESSGISTLDFSIAIDDKGNVQISQATDSIRGLKAGIKNVTGIGGGILFDAAAQFGGSMLSSWVSSKISGHKSSGKPSSGKPGKTGKRSKLGKAVDMAKGVGSSILENLAFDKITDLGGKVLGKGKKGLGKVLSKGKGVLGKVASKGKGIFSKVLGGTTEKAAGKATTKVAGKTLLKTGAKSALKAVPYVGEALMLADAVGWVGKQGKKMISKGKKNAEEGKDGLITKLVRNTLGDDAANGLQDFVWGTHSKKSKKKSKSKKKTTKKKDTYIAKQKDLLKQFNAMLDKAEKIIALAKAGDSGSGDSAGDVDGSHSGTDWTDKIKEVAKAMGQTISDEQVQTLQKLINAESGGNENVGKQNISDINSAKGHPAQGLLQYVDTTFDKYKVSGHTNINSGVDQLYAFFNNSSWASDLERWKNTYNPAAGQTGWGPTGTPIKHAAGGLVSRATALSNGDVVGEDGLEAIIPLNGKHFNDGKNVLKSLAGAFGSTLVDNTELSSMSTRKNISLNPSYNLSVNLQGDETASDVEQAVLQQLESTRSNMNEKLLNYYSQSITQA